VPCDLGYPFQTWRLVATLDQWVSVWQGSSMDRHAALVVQRGGQAAMPGVWQSKTSVAQVGGWTSFIPGPPVG
jgi:hypothetical protein